MPKVKKLKQKQKQSQKQSVVVHVHTSKRGKPRAKRGGGGGGQTGAGGRTIYTNAPGDYAPIIHNVIPPAFNNIPTISLPISALENRPIPPTVVFPTPTQLQTHTEDVRPLLSAIKSEPVKRQPFNYVENPMNPSGFREEIEKKLASPNKGLNPVGIRKPRENLSHLTLEEKRVRANELAKERRLKKAFP